MTPVEDDKRVVQNVFRLLGMPERVLTEAA
jgi:hypothetical protein